MVVKGYMIRVIRHQMRMSREEMARRLNISKGCLIRAERGEIRLDTAAAERLCRISGAKLHMIR